ncbi:MAG: hypothetical protein JSU70_03735 [Phycisphaerales bacterium]|nr:MAG: hypothetical protein JSU70_03735 [Phycisphaerales bacterium]
MTQPRVVMVKFARASSCPEQRSRISTLVGDDLLTAEQLFPGETDPQLATLWEVQLKGDASIQQVMENLHGDKDIEYAHEPEERRGLS